MKLLRRTVLHLAAGAAALHEEPDFGRFEADGHRIFFKIDYYDKAFTCLFPDPADPAVTQRVITIMLAKEYRGRPFNNGCAQDCLAPMEITMVFEDVPGRIIQELKTADRSRTKELFNVAIQIAALCQQKLDLRSVMSTLQNNGDAVISIVAGKKSAVPYARVHRISRKIEITGKLPTS